MKTREQLKAEYDSALEQLNTEERLRAVLVERGAQSPRMIHQHRLYGSDGSLVFGDSYSGSSEKVTLEQLRDLLRALPPVSTVIGKGTFTRFMTEAFADSNANKEREREDLTSIFPVRLKTNSVAGYSVKAEWFTEIDGQVWSVGAYMANPWSLARVDARRVDFRGGHRYENATLHISDTLKQSGDGYWQQIRWGRGSDEYPNDFTAYRTQYDDDPVEWIESVIQAQQAVTA